MFRKKSVLRIVLLLVIETVLARRPPNHICKQYTYNKEADGYIKYQEVPATWLEARAKCLLEGTLVASPLNMDLQYLMMDMVNGTSLVWTGMHSTLSRGDFASVEGGTLFETVEWMKGEPESCLVQLPWGTLANANCKDTHPYLCFSPGHTINSCGNDPEYILNHGECFKFHKDPLTYDRALMTCLEEHADLGLIHSAIQAEELKLMFFKNSLPTDNEILLGFRYWSGNNKFLKTNGKTLEQVGFEKFMPNIPTINMTINRCGAVNPFHALLTHVNCYKKATFICEKSPEAFTCDQ